MQNFIVSVFRKCLKRYVDSFDPKKFGMIVEMRIKMQDGVNLPIHLHERTKTEEILNINMQAKIDERKKLSKKGTQ
jgi:hypothetical protein